MPDEITFAESFNSSMVRLGVVEVIRQICHFSGFNSSMVRLGEIVHNFLQKVVNLFQFQYGAIRRRFEIRSWKPDYRFQFQYGAIRRK